MKRTCTGSWNSRRLRTDGSEIWISAVGVRTEYEGRLAALVSIRDITEQRKAEKALQESQRELQAVFDGARDGIALFDVTGRLIGVNKRAAGGWRLYRRRTRREIL